MAGGGSTALHRLSAYIYVGAGGKRTGRTYIILERAISFITASQRHNPMVEYADPPYDALDA